MGRRLKWITQPAIGRRYPVAFHDFLDTVSLALDNGNVVEYRNHATGERLAVCARKNSVGETTLCKVALLEVEAEADIQLTESKLEEMKEQELAAQKAEEGQVKEEDEEEPVRSYSNDEIIAAWQAWAWGSSTTSTIGSEIGTTDSALETATLIAHSQEKSELSDLMLQLQYAAEDTQAQSEPPVEVEALDEDENEDEVLEEDIDILAADWDASIAPEAEAPPAQPSEPVTIQIEIEEVAPQLTVQPPGPTPAPSPVDAIQQQARAIAQFANELYDAWKLLAYACSESDGPDSEPWGKAIELEQIYRTSFAQVDGTYFVLQVQQAHAMKLTPRFHLVSIPGANLKIGKEEAGAIAYPAPEQEASQTPPPPILAEIQPGGPGRQDRQQATDLIREGMAQMGDTHFARATKTPEKISGLNWLKRLVGRK